MNYRTAGLSDVIAATNNVANEARSIFGHLTPSQLNWNGIPPVSQWHKWTSKESTLQTHPNQLDITRKRLFTTVSCSLPGNSRSIPRLARRSSARLRNRLNKHLATFTQFSRPPAVIGTASSK